MQREVPILRELCKTMPLLDTVAEVKGDWTRVKNVYKNTAFNALVKRWSYLVKLLCRRFVRFAEWGDR